MSIDRAFDEIRFGAERTLNLRDGLPTAARASARAEAWLREKQVARAGEVLIVTGRGAGSYGGIAVVREAVERVLAVLRRGNVVREWREHTAGSFVVVLAPMSALFEAPKRRRPSGDYPVVDPVALKGLSSETRELLRQLATQSLHTLGIASPTPRFVEDEMLRQFTRLAPALPRDGDREQAMDAAIRRALDEIEG